MHEYDISLKLLLRGSSTVALREVTGGIAIEKWLDVEMPEMQNTRVDLLGEAATGDLVHIELQSTNDNTMAVRMLEYCVRVYRLFGKFPRQILLYVGDPPMRMAAELIGPDLSFRYTAVDIRELDGELLLASDQVGDNVIAILARLRDRGEAVAKILVRVGEQPPGQRETALKLLLKLAGLRQLEEIVEMEAKKMPVFIDILENKVLGREYKRGRLEGLHAGELIVLRRQLEKRFGPIPAWAEEQLSSQSAAELEDLSLRVLEAKSIEELLQ